jgi:hypothetical protein
MAAVAGIFMETVAVTNLVDPVAQRPAGVMDVFLKYSLRGQVVGFAANQQRMAALNTNVFIVLVPRTCKPVAMSTEKTDKIVTHMRVTSVRVQNVSTAAAGPATAVMSK